MGALERRLGLFSVITISISSMVGSGIFVLPGIGFDATGPSLYLAFLLAAICILPAAMSKAELATAMPTSGGTYVYVERTFGPLAGTVSGLGIYISILLKACFALVGIGAYLSAIAHLPLLPVILTFALAISLLNIFGVGKVSGFLTFILGLTLISLVFLEGFSFSSWDPKNLVPFMTKGYQGLAAATALVFVSFAGVTKVAAIAEEIKDPEKNLPKGILFSLILVTILYCGVSLMLASYYPNELIAGEIRPIYRIANDVGGYVFGVVMAIIAILTMVNTANAGVLAASRFPFAMSRDQLMPAFLGKLHSRFLTPISSIVLSCVIIILVLVTMDVVKIAKLASAFMITIYIIENIAVVVLRESRAQWYKPTYKAPLYPGLQVFGVISGIFLLFAMGPIAITALVSITIPGVLFFIFYSRNKTDRKGVLGIRGKRTDLINKDQQTPQEIYQSFNLDRDARVVVGLFGKERSPEMLAEIGIVLAEHKSIEMAHITEVPEQTTLFDVLYEPAEVRSIRRRIMAMAHERGEHIDFDPVYSHDLSKTVYEISERLHCKWLLIEWRGRSRGTLTFHNPVGWLKAHLHCHLAVFKDMGVRYVRKIIVLLQDDRNDNLVLNTADHFGNELQADLTIAKVFSQDMNPGMQDEQRAEMQQKAAHLKSTVHFRLLFGAKPADTLISELVEYDLLVMGSLDHSIKRQVFGSFEDRVMERAACSVLAITKQNF